MLTLTIKGTAEQNPDAAGHASPVAVRVYQLSGTAKFEQSDVFALKDDEAKTLGTEEATGSSPGIPAGARGHEDRDDRPEANGVVDRRRGDVSATSTTRNGAPTRRRSRTADHADRDGRQAVP